MIRPAPPVLDRTGILIGGRRFEDWIDYRVTSDIFSGANEFSLRCGAASAEVIQTILPGRECSIYFGDGTDDNEHIVITGWVEHFAHTVSKSDMTADISGRDVTSDLRESTVPMDVKVKGKKLADVAAAVCDPFGINVLVTNEINRLAVADKKRYKQALQEYNGDAYAYQVKVWDLMNGIAEAAEIGDYVWDEKQCKQALASAGIKAPVRPPFVGGIFKALDDAEPKDGQSCWDFLADYARRLEVWMWATANGAIVLQRPRYDQDPLYQFVVNEKDPRRNNVIACTYDLNIAGIPTSLTRVGRVKGDGKKERVEHAVKSTRIVPGTEDTILPTKSQDMLRVAASFYRPAWGVDTEARNLKDLQLRAYYAMKAKEMAFVTLSLTVRGHDQGGILYAPDTVCRLEHERLGIDGLYYVAAVEYRMGAKASGSTGRQTDLTLTPLDAWSPAE